MSYEAWRAIAERFGLKYGVEVYIGGDRAYSTKNAIYLPGDCPEKMQDAVHAMFLREKQTIIEKDWDFNLQQGDAVLTHALEVVQDIHNDTLVLEQDPGAESMYQKMVEYMDKKWPPEELRKMLHWKQKAVYELINRGWPRSVSDGRHMTDDRRVKHFFKANSYEIKMLLRDMKDLRPDRDAQVKWAKWLVEKLFDEVIQMVCDKNGITFKDGQGNPLPEKAQEAILEALKQMGGLQPQGTRPNFECISAGDLKQKVPERVTIQKLKEFLTETLEQVNPDDQGTIDPSKLPTYWNENEDPFMVEKEKLIKRVRVTLLLDTSGSMDGELEDGNKKRDALMRAVGLVCQAVDRISRDEGLDVSVEAWAFGHQDRLIKRPDDRWEPGTFKRNYWRGGDGNTFISDLVRNIAAVPGDSKTKDVVVVVTDGVFSADGNEKLREQVQSNEKKWLLVGIGADIQDAALFRSVAKSLEEIEFILCQIVKEATV
jgi:hypothetical protein